MREQAKTLFQVAVAAADPAKALRPHLTDLPAISGRYLVIAVGKAACTMAQEALRQVPDAAAIAVTNYENAREVAGCTVMAAGHPVPDENGEKAGRAVIELLQSAGENDVVLALISGGGSALLPTPVAGITLNDKAEVSRVLLSAGFDITEMNLVRQQLSVLKGGGMARLAAPASVKAYILSDVIGDDLRVIASGPTVSPIGTRADVVALLGQRGVFDQMPDAVRRVLETPAEQTDLIAVENVLVGSNRHSLEAMFAADPEAKIVSTALVGDVADAARTIIDAAKTHSETVLIFGGETTVTISGTGKGGRNQELALRVAMLAENENLGEWVFLSGGTDGRDGPTDAAGGIVDNGTLGRIRRKADVDAMLANNDSYHALKIAGDLLMTGSTGTNVADIQIFIRT